MISYQVLLCLLIAVNTYDATEQFEKQCGLEELRFRPLVARGSRVPTNHFPWHVSIFQSKGTPGTFQHVCGGTIIRRQIVITAAHCFDENPVEVNLYRVMAGALNSSWEAQEMGRQMSEILKVNIGEQYEGEARNFQDDIAVVFLKSNFTYSDTVRAVCLDLDNWEFNEHQLRPGNLGRVAGWGLTERRVPSEALMTLTVPVIGDRDCVQMIPKHKRFIINDKICAGFSNGSSLCPGDSGGGLVFPLVQNDGTHKWYLRGLVSNGPESKVLSDPCAHSTYTLYTSVFKHRLWLSKLLELLQPQGTFCSVKGTPGICRPFSSCEVAIEAASRGNLPQKCLVSSYGGEFVCCPDTCPPLQKGLVTQEMSRSTAENYCVSLADKLFPCQSDSSGWSRGNLCGPEPESTVFEHATPFYSAAEVPFYSMLGERTEGGRSLTWRCYGALVSDQWVLSSAFCAIMSEYGSGTQYVGLGGRWSDKYYPDQVIQIAGKEYHPSFNVSLLLYVDIILVKLSQKVTFTRNIMPACLHTKGQLLPRMLTLFRRHEKISVQQFSDERCSEIFRPENHIFLTEGVDRNTQMCARPAASINGHLERCNSEPVFPKAPLATYNWDNVACTWMLVGFYADAAISPTCMQLFTRVAPFVPWIESVVWP